jgi:hypothetical protein
MIDMENDTNLYLRGGIDGDTYMSRLGGTRLFRQIVEVLSVDSGTNLTVTPPLVWNYTNKPQVVYLPYVFRWASIEDFTITNACPTNLPGSLILMSQAADCWIKNVASHKAYTHNICLSYAFRCAVVGCELRWHAEYRYSGRAYGLEVRYASTQNLLEDNIFDELRSGAVFTSSGPYNVWAYNYFHHGYNGDTGILLGWGVNHGGNPSWALWEGNVGTGFTADLFHGGSSYQTLFRNYARGWHPNPSASSTNYWWRCINLWASNMFYNVVGNVLGSPNVQEGNPYTDRWVYEQTTGALDPRQPVIFRLGYTSVGGDKSYPETAATLFRHGNFDWAHTNVVDWQAGYETNLPPSLYLRGKPDWFGTLTWPPIGPEKGRWLHTNNAIIPAQARYHGIPYLLQVSRPTQPRNLRLAP